MDDFGTEAQKRSTPAFIFSPQVEVGTPLAPNQVTVCRVGPAGSGEIVLTWVNIPVTPYGHPEQTLWALSGSIVPGWTRPIAREAALEPDAPRCDMARLSTVRQSDPAPADHGVPVGRLEHHHQQIGVCGTDESGSSGGGSGAGGGGHCSPNRTILAENLYEPLTGGFRAGIVSSCRWTNCPVARVRAL